MATPNHIYFPHPEFVKDMVVTLCVDTSDAMQFFQSTCISVLVVIRISLLIEFLMGID